MLQLQTKPAHSLNPSQLRRAHSLSHAPPKAAYLRSVHAESMLASSMVAGSLPVLTSTSSSQSHSKGPSDPPVSSSHSHWHSTQAGLVTVPFNGLVVSPPQTTLTALLPHTPSGDSPSPVEVDGGQGKLVRKSPLSVPKFSQSTCLPEEPATEEECISASKEHCVLKSTCPLPSSSVAGQPTTSNATEGIRSSNFPPHSPSFQQIHLQSCGSSPLPPQANRPVKAKPFLTSSSHNDVFCTAGPADRHTPTNPRAHSCGDFFLTSHNKPDTSSTSSPPNGLSPVEVTYTSTRMRIDTLSQYMWDALESKATSFPEQFENPFLVAVKNILKVMAPFFDIVSAQDCSLHSKQNATELTVQHDLDFSPPDSVLQLNFGSPSPGFVTLLFQVCLRGSSHPAGNNVHLKVS